MLSKENAGVLIFSTSYRREPDIGIKPFWHVAPNEHHNVLLMWHKEGLCASSFVDTIKHVQQRHIKCVCLCVSEVSTCSSTPRSFSVSWNTNTSSAQIQPKTKITQTYIKIHTPKPFYLSHLHIVHIPPHPISQACKMGCLFTLKHGPKRMQTPLITLPSLSFSLSIHLFPLSRRYQLEETDVSSCFTSWLNFFGLWCSFLEWRPVCLRQERPWWQIRMDFKSLCSLATEDSIPAHPHNRPSPPRPYPSSCECPRFHWRPGASNAARAKIASEPNRAWEWGRWGYHQVWVSISWDDGIGRWSEGVGVMGSTWWPFRYHLSNQLCQELQYTVPPPPLVLSVHCLLCSLHKLQKNIYTYSHNGADS